MKTREKKREKERQREEDERNVYWRDENNEQQLTSQLTLTNRHLHFFV